MRSPRTWLLLALTAWVVHGCRMPAALPPYEGVPGDVLFVGNSFTYYNNSLHNHYRRMVVERAESGGMVRSMTISGGRLREHRRGLRQRLDENHWQAVVLQGHSKEPLEHREEFEEEAVTYAGWIRRRGARPVLLMTWAYSGAPEMTDVLRAAYTEVGERAGAQVVPVGVAFGEITERHPEIPLRVEDGRHPTLAGTYLAACTMFAALRGESPVGLAYTAGLSDTQASILQQVAWETVQRFEEQPR